MSNHPAEDLARRGRSPNTVRAYRADLAAFTRFHTGPPQTITAKTLRDYLAGLGALAAATAPAARRRWPRSWPGPTGPK